MHMCFPQPCPSLRNASALKSVMETVFVESIWLTDVDFSMNDLFGNIASHKKLLFVDGVGGGTVKSPFRTVIIARRQGNCQQKQQGMTRSILFTTHIVPLSLSLRPSPSRLRTEGGRRGRRASEQGSRAHTRNGPSKRQALARSSFGRGRSSDTQWVEIICTYKGKMGKIFEVE